MTSPSSYVQPWARRVRQSACGMREAISRVWFLSPSEAIEAFRWKSTDTDSLAHALRMRVTQPEVWARMVDALGLRAGRPIKSQQ